MAGATTPSSPHPSRIERRAPNEDHTSRRARTPWDRRAGERQHGGTRNGEHRGEVRMTERRTLAVEGNRRAPEPTGPAAPRNNSSDVQEQSIGNDDPVFEQRHVVVGLEVEKI